MTKDLRLKNINCHCERKRSNLYLLFNGLPRILWTLAMTLVLLSTFSVNEVHAQTVDPSVWQTGATGLRATANNESKTAGLSIIIKASSVPFMSLQGGVKNGGWGRVIGPTTVDLGEIKLPGINPSLVSQVSDWSHNEMSFTNNLNIWISRLSPAVLVQNLNNSLRLFSGNLNGGVFAPGSAIGEPWYQQVVQGRTPSPVYPKYIAYSSGGNIRVQQIPASGTTALSLPDLDSNWILVWYGNNSYFVDTKKPLTYSGTSDNYPESNLAIQYTYQADPPMLIKFQNNPTSIIQTSEGGIDLAFNGNSGYTSMMPLLGREHLKATDTEGWGTSGTLPANVLTKINFWNTNNRLCSYPTTVSETYAYDTSSDTSTISENINYLNVCLGGSTTSGFTILPPSVSLAKDALGTSFNISGTPTDANYPTEFGPIIGIDNTNHYSYSISGFKKYTDVKRVATNSNGAPADLLQSLIAQVDKLIAAGHLAPWVAHDAAQGDLTGSVEFINPADTIYHLAEVIPILPEPQKTNLINYLKSERTNFPPETVYNLSLTQGTAREDYALPLSRTSIGPTYAQRWEQFRSDIFLKQIPLYNFYALANYYDVTGDTVPSSVLTAAVSVLNANMAEQDWATFYWFKGFDQQEVAVENVNRHLAGLVGLTKLAKKANNSQVENLSRALLAKTALERIAFLEYPSYLYTSGLMDLASLPANWQPLQLTTDFYGYIINYNWQNANDDVRQMLTLNQFESYLSDHSGTSRVWRKAVNPDLITFKGMVPEAFRFLADFDKSKAEIYVKKVETYIPSWYLALDSAQVGAEHGTSHPGDSFQIFMAKDLINGESAQNLARYTSFPWLNIGDFFYMQKLAETIKAYEGVTWEDQTYLAGDINQDHTVNLDDIKILFDNWNMPRDRRADANGDGVVNGVDFGLLLKDWGK